MTTSARAFSDSHSQLIQRGEVELREGLPVGGGYAADPSPLLHGSGVGADLAGDGGRSTSVDDDLVMGSHDVDGYITYPKAVNVSGRLNTRSLGIFYAMSERHDRLRQARIAAGFKTQAEAVRRFGWNPNTYKSNENGNAPFSFDQGREYARAFKVNPEWLYAASGPMRAGDGMVPIIGRVGADTEGRVVRTLTQAANDLAPAPTGGTSKSVALEVDGHSMRGFADDGALVYFENQHTPPTEDMLGEVVVLQIATGEHDADDEDVLVKRLLRGSRDGLYDLESIVGPTMRDVQVRWAAEIIQIIPPKQARRLIRRGYA